MNYDDLKAVLNEAFEQATRGKGDARHAAGREIEKQPALAISALLQDDAGYGHIYQAMKKLQESMRVPSEQRRAERLGAIVYIAWSLLLPGCKTE